MIDEIRSRHTNIETPKQAGEVTLAMEKIEKSLALLSERLSRLQDKLVPICIQSPVGSPDGKKLQAQCQLASALMMYNDKIDGACEWIASLTDGIQI